MQKVEIMNNTMLDFVNLRDRISYDNDARLIRRNLAKHFYEIC